MNKVQTVKTNVNIYSLCDDLIVEIVIFMISVCQRIYNALLIKNKNKVVKTQISNIVSFLYQWIPTIDNQAKEKLLQQELLTNQDVYATMVNSQNIILKV